MCVDLMVKAWIIQFVNVLGGKMEDMRVNSDLPNRRGRP